MMDGETLVGILTDMLGGMLGGSADGWTFCRFGRTKRTMGDYIDINCLPFDASVPLATAHMNVNVHTKDNMDGTARRSEAFGMATRIAEIFREDQEADGVWFSISDYGEFSEDADSTHFVNIYLQVNFSNI